MLQQTPQQLIDILSISNKKFNDHKELTNYVSENSRLFKIPYSAYLTGSNRKTQKFCCRYGGRTYGINSAKTNCQSYICYTLDSNGKCSICEFNWFHNHSLEPEFTEAHCNCLPRSTKLKIQEFQRLCVSPGSIRCSLNIAINPNNFYNIRREVIRTLKIESLDDVLKEIKQNCLLSNIYKSKDGEIIGITVAFDKVCSQIYSKNILIVDDTSSTNIYNWILEVAVAIDQEGKNQLLMYGLFPDKSLSSYQLFFKDLKSYLKVAPRVIVVDRSISQYSAIQSELPETFVCFCLRHLGKDLLKYFNENSDIVKGYYLIQNEIFKADEYLNYISDLTKKDDYKDIAILKWMIEYHNNWVPKNLIINGIVREWTTNRAEGLFGNFKQTYGFTRFPMKKLIKNLNTYMKGLFANSIASQSKTNIKYQTLDCFDESDIPKIGKYALSTIAEEYYAFKAGIDNSPYCYLCALHLFNPDIELPCRHRMQDKIDIKSIPRLYLRNNDNTEMRAEQNILIMNKMKRMDYSDYMGKIAPYASIANREPNVAKILNDTIEKLNSEQVEINKGMPLTFALRGRISSHPANNVVMGGRPKTQKSYCCSICRQPGHNKNHCPNK